MIKIKKFEEGLHTRQIKPYVLDALYLNGKLVGFNYYGHTFVDDNYSELKGYNYIVDPHILDPKRSTPAELFAQLEETKN